MKTKFTPLLASVCLVLLSACSKELATKPNEDGMNNEISLAATIAPVNKVVTIAGLANSPGFTNGTGANARFNIPMGIQLLKDGSIYVADRSNDAIRKVSPDGNVTTEELKADSNGNPVIKPMYVGEDDRKNLHIICATDGDAYSHSFIYSPQRILLERFDVPYSVESCLAKDPYYDVFYSSSGHSVGTHQLSANPIAGTSRGFSADEFFPPFTSRGSSFKGLFMARNKVIYASSGSLILVHSPGGKTSRLTNYQGATGAITSIVLNADSKSMYLAADGFILAIVNGKVIKLAGPNAATPDGRDGVGLKADVYANSLALGDHENTLYFSDTKSHTIRKLILK